MSPSYLDKIKWNSDGLVAAIAQDAESGRVLMMAWMNREALRATLETGHAVYWSRSRAKLWPKGESSGHVQKVREVRIDCDADALLILIEQIGGIACHTGRQSCFYRSYDQGEWRERDTVIKPPDEIYR